MEDNFAAVIKEQRKLLPWLSQFVEWLRAQLVSLGDDYLEESGMGALLTWVDSTIHCCELSIIKNAYVPLRGVLAVYRNLSAEWRETIVKAPGYSEFPPPPDLLPAGVGGVDEAE